MIFARVELPLQGALLATFTLFTAVGYWNEWFWSTLLINSGSKMTLQVVLKAIVAESAALEDVSTGEAGMILIGGCQVMQGYLKDPDRTASVIVNIGGVRYYRTGDKGYLDEDGFLTIVDRYSRFAKLGGEMVSLGAVEKKIQDTPVLEGCDYVVTTVPDSAKGEKIVLLYQGDKDPKQVLSELRASGFPPIMLPALAFPVEKVPKLGTGKADFTGAMLLAKELLSISHSLFIVQKYLYGLSLGIIFYPAINSTAAYSYAIYFIFHFISPLKYIQN